MAGTGILLYGRRASAWARDLGRRVRVAPEPSGAGVWIVDAGDPLGGFAGEGVVVLTAGTVQTCPDAASALARAAVWVLVADPSTWLVRLLDLLDAGTPLEEALRDLGARPLGELVSCLPAPARMPLPAADDLDTACKAQPPPPLPAGDQLDADLDSACEAPPASDRRRLVAELRSGGKIRRKALPPHASASLEVAIAVPKRGQAAGTQALDLPTDVDAVVLDVVASGSPWPAPVTRQLWVTTSDVEQPSTVAAFEFVAPGEGELVAVQLDVLYAGRPLQRANLAIPARARPLPGDRLRLVTRNTSAGPLPQRPPAAPAATIVTRPQPATVTLDATASDLVELATGAKVPLAATTAILDALSLLLSRTLGASDAPESLDGEAARVLLVELARRGVKLRDRFAPLGLADAAAVDLLVQPATPLLPLELCYDGPAPRASAKVCAHARGRASCGGASVGVVCPYAFWGLRKEICRTVLLAPGRVPPPPAPLALSPTLYAATARADAGSPAGALPSEELRREASGVVGDVTQVTSWRAWRTAVKRKRPGLLLLLAHMEEAPGESYLQIGANSLLASSDLRTSDLAAGASPPLVVLMACATAATDDAFGSFHAALTARGAAAVVGTLGQLNGPQGARAAAAILRSLADAGRAGHGTLGAALTEARRSLLAAGLLVALLLVSHGEVNTEVA